MADAKQKLRERIKKHEKKLAALKKKYAADGTIDAKERAHLDELFDTILKLDVALADGEGENAVASAPENSTSTTAEPDPAAAEARLSSVADAMSSARATHLELARVAPEAEVAAIAKQLDTLEQARAKVAGSGDPAAIEGHAAEIERAILTVEHDAKDMLKRRSNEMDHWLDRQGKLKDAESRIEAMKNAGGDVERLERHMAAIRELSGERAHLRAAEGVDELEAMVRRFEREHADNAEGEDGPFDFEFKERDLTEGFKKEFKGEEIEQHFKDAAKKFTDPNDITDPVEGVAEMVETTGEAIENAGKGLQEFGEGMGEKTEAKMRGKGEFTEAVAAVTGEFGEMAAEATGEIAGGALEGVGKVVKGAGSAADGVLEGVDHMLDGEIGEGVGKITDGAKDLVGGTLEGAVDVGAGMIKGGGEVIEGGAAIVGEMGEGILEMTGIIDDNDSHHIHDTVKKAYAEHQKALREKKSKK